MFATSVVESGCGVFDFDLDLDFDSDLDFDLDFDLDGLRRGDLDGLLLAR